MLSTIKGYLYLAVGILFLVVICAVVYGLHKTYNNYQIAKELRIDTAAEKVATDVVIKQDVAVAKIDKAGDDSTAKLQDILKDATVESSERSQPAAPTNTAKVDELVVVKPIAKTATKGVRTPSSVAPASPATVAVAGHSDTTTRTIDELWNNYCTLFPRESSCDRQKDSAGGVQTGTTAR